MPYLKGDLYYDLSDNKADLYVRKFLGKKNRRKKQEFRLIITLLIAIGCICNYRP